MSQSDDAKRQYKIRIEASCFLETATPSGIGRYTEQLISQLRSNEAVTLDTVCGIFPSSWVFANKLYRKLNHYLPSALQIPIDLFRRPVDATIFPNFSSQPTIQSARRLVIIHDLVYIDYPETVESKNLSFLSKEVPRSFATCDTIIATSNTLATRYKSLFPPSKGQQHLILPIPVSSSYYTSPTTTRQELATKYGFSDNEYIYFIGNMEPRKNLRALVDAYLLLPSSITDRYSLIIAGGGGWKSSDLVSHIDKLQQGGHKIYRIGYVDEADTVALMHHASLHCLPSIDEGFGTSIYQAMATRTVVVANDIPILREVANGHAYLADATSADSLSAALQTALTTDNSGLIESAYSHTQATTWDSVIEKLLKNLV